MRLLRTYKRSSHIRNSTRLALQCVQWIITNSDTITQDSELWRQPHTNTLCVPYNLCVHKYQWRVHDNIKRDTPQTVTSRSVTNNELNTNTFLPDYDTQHSSLKWFIHTIHDRLWTVNKTQCLVIDNSEPNAAKDSSIGLLYAVCQSHMDTRTTHNTTKTEHTQNEEKITRTHQQ